MQRDDPEIGLRNMRYTIYDRETGEILLSGVAGSPKSLNSKVQAGQGLLIDVQGDGRTHRVNPETGRLNKRR